MFKNVKLIAHRGASAIECENTAEAFELACGENCFGVECDVHVTADGKYVIFHDDETGRMCFENLTVEKSAFDVLRALEFRRGKNYKIPSLEEYLQIMKRSGKTAVIELKNPMAEKNIAEICAICAEKYDLDKIIFISFCFENLLVVRSILPEQKIQFLTCAVTKELADELVKNNFGIDLDRVVADENAFEILRERNIPVNCWTVDDEEEAEKLARLGAEFITTNIIGMRRD